MSASRIKNLILLILALAVCFLLLAVVPAKQSARRAETAVHEQLTELVASYGVTLDEGVLGQSELLYAIELENADEQAVVQALTGVQMELDSASTRYESRYTATGCTVTLSRSGVLAAELSASAGGTKYERDMRRRLKAMDCNIWQVFPAVRDADGVYTLAIQQSLLGMPVFGSRLTFTYAGQTLRAAAGTFYPESATVTRVSEDGCISCAVALISLLASRDETGWVGSRIVSMEQGYLHAETATAALRFVPVWRIETDTAAFYVNGLTREIQQAPSER